MTAGAPCTQLFALHSTFCLFAVQLHFAAAEASLRLRDLPLPLLSRTCVRTLGMAASQHGLLIEGRLWVARRCDTLFMQSSMRHGSEPKRYAKHPCTHHLVRICRHIIGADIVEEEELMLEVMPMCKPLTQPALADSSIH